MKTILKKLVAVFTVFALVLTISPETASAASGSKLLTYTSTLDTSYDIEIDITANYKNGKWTSVSQIQPSVDSNSIVFSYKISNNTLTCDVTSSKIVLSGGFTITKYYGVAGYGIIKAGSQKFSVTKTFKASSYL